MISLQLSINFEAVTKYYEVGGMPERKQPPEKQRQHKGAKVIYREQLKIPSIHFCNDDFRNQIDAIDRAKTVIVTDPPFNIGYHYNEYKDKMGEKEYYDMLVKLVNTFPSVIIHYPEALHRLTMESRIMPQKNMRMGLQLKHSKTTQRYSMVWNQT